VGLSRNSFVFLRSVHRNEGEDEYRRLFLASVGLQESEATEQGLDFKTHFERTGSWYSSARIGEEYSAYKVLLEKGSGRILGAHILGPNAEELINLFTMAMAGGLHSEDIKGMIFGYPTYASDISYMI